MSAAHTEGRLIVGKLSGNTIELKHTNGDVPGAISLVIARVTARPTWITEAEANARRLAACWNAFDSVPTEEIERFSDDDPIMRVFKALGRAKVASDYLNIANTLLSDALEVFDADLSKDHEVADRIREFLKGQP